MTVEEIKAKLAELEEAALAHFCENHGWRKEYERAPEGAKRYYRHTFGFSCGVIGCGGSEESVQLFAEAFAEGRDDIYRTMDNESWDYVIKNAGSVAAKIGLRTARVHMQGREGAKYGDWFAHTHE